MLWTGEVAPVIPHHAAPAGPVLCGAGARDGNHLLLPGSLPWWSAQWYLHSAAWSPMFRWLAPLGIIIYKNICACDWSKLVYILGMKILVHFVITINAPMYKFNWPVHNFFRRMFFITRAIGPMNRDFFGAHEIARAVRRVRFGAQKSRDSWAQSPEYWKNPAWKKNAQGS